MRCGAEQPLQPLPCSQLRLAELAARTVLYVPHLSALHRELNTLWFAAMASLLAARAARASVLQTDKVTGKVFHPALPVNSFYFEGHEKATKG